MTRIGGEEHDMVDATLATISDHAMKIRQLVLEMVGQAGSGHIDSCLSIAELIAVLYKGVMRFRPNEPAWPDRDRLVLSKGHAAPALYVALALAGFFPVTELATLRRQGSRLQGHPRRNLPGIDVATGSLGQGLSIAAGLALAHERFKPASPVRTFCVLSDGELNEGQTWEAFMFAGHQQLRSLCAIVDLNGLQYTGRTMDVLALPRLAEQVTEFGWTVLKIDGHSVPEIYEALKADNPPGPKLVIARTVKGKGVDFMENSLEWHGKVPSGDLLGLAVDQVFASMS